MSDLFEEKRISPMLIAENVAPFADERYLYEMKWDGERCVAYIDPPAGKEAVHPGRGAALYGGRQAQL